VTTEQEDAVRDVAEGFEVDIHWLYNPIAEKVIDRITVTAPWGDVERVWFFFSPPDVREVRDKIERAVADLKQRRRGQWAKAMYMKPTFRADDSRTITFKLDWINQGALDLFLGGDGS